MPKTVLVIDDEPDLIKLLDYNLTQADYLVLSARDGEGGLSMARRHQPDVVVLDVMMSGMDGLEVCKRLRSDPATSGVPILMLTAKAEEADRVLGLELGADDYLTKPFGIRELLARVKALLRRRETAANPKEVLRVGAILIDSGQRCVRVEERDVGLTATEFNLLRALAERPGRVLSRDDLLERARGGDTTVVERTIDVHIAAIRRKLGRRGSEIETVRGVGYRLRE